MRMVVRIVGVILMILGAIWLLQGINVLKGSMMSGQTKWAINGGIMLVVGLGLRVWSSRMPKG